MDLTKNELIIKLEDISALHKKALAIKKKMLDFEPEDNYERTVKVPKFPLELNNEYDEEVLKLLENDVDHTVADAIEYMSKCYDTAYYPQKPAEYKEPTYKGADTRKSREKQSKFKLISNIGLGVCIFFLLGAIFGTDTLQELPPILIIAALGAAAFFGGKYLGKKEKEVEDRLEAEAKAEYDTEIARLEQQYKNTIKLYEDECNAYILVRKEFLKKYADWREIYLESVKEELEISEKLEAERQAKVEKINNEEFTPVLNDLAELNDLLTTEYLPAVDIIVDLLKSGRADDLKEAINLYEDIVYRERQLQLEREKEAQRHHEEELRRQDEERRYQEEKAFREEQEWNRRQEERERQLQEERRYQEEMKKREMQEFRREQQEKERLRKENLKQQAELQREKDRLWKAGSAQCRACAYAGRCNMMVHNHAPTCTGFKPR